ncbi:hypothetical protein FIBSPDRAFT_87030 [Athelia psychrophila]|uniref:Uncharacterized protein n=1 Tax=Athelia psychrophila TaxID=1759441 RepID=A0A166E2S0_9AGAM|nr:hypothetical protein FIBSPDRAFT_87030 [Fibularhizoctonia sp. CBS 109695]
MAIKIRRKQLKKPGSASPSTPPNNDSDGAVNPLTRPSHDHDRLQTHDQGQDPEAQVGLAESSSPPANASCTDSSRASCPSPYPSSARKSTQSPGRASSSRKQMRSSNACEAKLRMLAVYGVDRVWGDPGRVYRDHVECGGAVKEGELAAVIEQDPERCWA